MGGKHQNWDMEGTEPREIVTQIKKEIQVEEKSAKNFIILATLKKMKVIKRTKAKFTKLQLVILGEGTACRKEIRQIFLLIRM